MRPLTLITKMFQLQRKSFFQTSHCGLVLFCMLSLSITAKFTESLTVSDIYITTTPPPPTIRDTETAVSIATTRPRPPTLSTSSSRGAILPFHRLLNLNAAKNSKNNNQFHNSSVTFSTSASSSSLSSSSSSRPSSKIKFVEAPSTFTQSNESNQSNSGSSSGSGSDLRPKRQLFREDIPHHRPLTGNHYAHIHGFPLPGRFSNNPNDPKSGVNNNPVDENDVELNSNQLTGHDNGNINVGVGAEEEEYDPNVHTIVHNHHHHVAPVHVHHGEGGTGQGGTGGGETAVHNPGTTTTEFKNEIIHQYPVEVSQYLQLDHPHPGSGAIEQVQAPVFPQANTHPVELDVKIPLYNEAIHGPDPDEPTSIGKEPSVVDELSGHGHLSSPYGGSTGTGTGTLPYVYSHQHQQQYPHHLHLHPHFHRRPSKFIHLLKTWPLILQKMRHRRPIWPLFRATSFRTKIKHPHPPHYYAKY